MPRLQSFDIDPANVNAAGIANDLPTGTAWSLSGDAEWTASDCGDSLAHQLVVTTAGNEPAGNAPNLTLVGTDANDNAITDTVVLPNITTVETTLYFKTVTSASADAATVGTMDIGWVDEVASKTVPLNRHSSTGGLIQLDVTGTIDVTLQVTAASPDSPVWMNSNTAALVNATTDVMANLDIHSTAVRLIVNSYTDTAEVQVYLSEGSK